MAQQKFRVGDLVTINPIRKDKYREEIRDSIGKVGNIKIGRDRLTYLVFFEGRNGAHTYRFTAYDLRPVATAAPNGIGMPHVERKETEQGTKARTMEVDITRARAWYHSDNKALQSLALELFREDELKCERPKSWEELCDNYAGPYFWRDGATIKEEECNCLDCDEAVDVLPTRELLERHTAMGQLLFAHHLWTGGWQPNWDDSSEIKHCIVPMSSKRITVQQKHSDARPLYFRTFQDAVDFGKAYKKLIDKAYGLF